MGLVKKYSRNIIIIPYDLFVGSLNCKRDFICISILIISTPTEFENNNGSTSYPSGELSIVAVDGSRLDMNADNGDPETFMLTITSDGSVTSLQVSWNEALYLP